MINVERRLRKLHEDYRQLIYLSEGKRKKSEQMERIPVLARFISKKYRYEYNMSKRAVIDKSNQIVDTLHARVGFYSLDECNYGQVHPLAQGFSYNFNYTLEGTPFNVSFFSQGRLGILAQGHEATYESQIEIRREHPHDVLHLPEGFVISVGPFYFEEESLPMDRKTQEERQEVAEKMLAVLNENQKGMLLAGGLNSYLEQTRIIPARYFNWMPTLLNTPEYVLFNVENHHPRYWGLTKETAPVYKETVHGLLQGFDSFPKNMEFVAKNCTRCKLLN